MLRPPDRVAAPVASGRRPGRAATPAPRLRERLVPWIFAAKTTAAALIALLIAFHLNLDQPYWALLSVFIVAQPKDGMVLAKSFYRVIGTVVGAIVALVLVALFAQERVLFLGGLALWIGLCTFASLYGRNWAAYGFVLSGYTVAIIGIPAALDPGNAFFTAVGRVTEISLGIAVAAGISHLVLPMSLAGSLRQAIDDARAELCGYSLAVLGARDGAPFHAKLLGRAVAIGNLGAAVVFEDRALRDRADTLRQLVVKLLGVIDIAQVLSREITTLRRDDPIGVAAIDEATMTARRAIEAWRDGAIDAAALGRRFGEADQQLPSLWRFCDDPAASADELMRRIAILGVLRRFFAAMLAYAAADAAVAAGERLTGRRAAVGPVGDFAGAAWAGLRAALAVVLVSGFWIVADWPHGATATTLAAVATARLASMGHAVPIAKAAVLIFSLSAIPAFIVVEMLLPLSSGFAMFALIVAPVLFVCAFLMALERVMIIGFLSALLFASVGTFQNRMAYDPVGFINTSIAAIVAAAVALVLWAIVAPESSAAARRRFARTARRLLDDAAAPRLAIGRSEFETAMSAALARLRGHVAPDRPAEMAALDAGTALLIAGRELVRLREGSRSSPAWTALEHVIAAAARKHGPRRLDRLRRAVEAAAEQCLTALRDGALNAEQVQAAARGIVALAIIREELARGAALLAGEETEALHAA